MDGILPILTILFLSFWGCSKTRTLTTARVPERKDHDLTRLHDVVDVVSDAGQEEAAQIRIPSRPGLGAYARLTR